MSRGMNANSRSKFRSSHSTWLIVLAVADRLGVGRQGDEVRHGQAAARAPPSPLIVVPISLGCCGAAAAAARLLRARPRARAGAMREASVG